MLDRFFHLSRAGTTMGAEVRAGVLTFAAMAYIVLVNPAIMQDAGMPHGAAFAATCIAAALGSILVALIANQPLALAPGMGISAFFVYGMVRGGGASWQEALGAVFVSGLILVVLTALPIRDRIARSVPSCLKAGTAAGLGLFLVFNAFQSAGLSVTGVETALAAGQLLDPRTALFFGTVVVMITLDRFMIPGSVVLAVMIATAAAVVAGLAPFMGPVDVPPSVVPVVLALDAGAALSIGLTGSVLALVFIDFCDTAATVAVANRTAGRVDADGQPLPAGRAQVADSLASTIGAVVGASSVTSYMESLVGVQGGGRTGLTALVVAGLFLAASLLSPLAAMVPDPVVAAAMLHVGLMMARSLAGLEWDDATEYAPALLCALVMPMTASVPLGIGIGFVAFVAGKLLTLQPRAVTATTVAITAIALLTMMAGSML